MDIAEAEKEFRWLEAAKFHENILKSKTDDPIYIAETWQKIGFCYSLASKQAGDIEEFKRLRQLAITSYETASEFFLEVPTADSQGRSAECFSLAEYNRSWLDSNSLIKDRILGKCLEFGKQAFDLFEKNGDKVGCGRTCNILSQCLFDRLYTASVEDEKMAFAQEGIERSEYAISVFRQMENDDLLLALSFGGLLSWYYANIGEEKLRKELSGKSLEYSEKAIELSKKVENPYTKALSLWAAALTTLFFTEKIECSLDYAKEMWQLASYVRDNYFKGIASYLLAFITDLMVPGEANPYNKKQKFGQIIGYSEEAIKSLRLLGQDEAIAEAYLVYPQSYLSLASEFAISPMEKLALSKKAVRIGEEGLEYAVRSGSPDAIGSNLHALSKAYGFYSKLEPRIQERLELLKKALDYRKQYTKVVKNAFASNYWILGVGLVYAAQIEADLANIESDKEKKTAFLQEAISDAEKGISLCEKWIESIGFTNAPSLVATLAEYEDTLGTILKENHSLTDDQNSLHKATNIYDQAAENFKRVDLPSRVAECYWKIASILDFLGNYGKASENFEKAFAGYRVSAHKIEQLNDFYSDYANYMKAWSEIENAKLVHRNGDYEIAMEHYEKASILLKESRLWNFLSLNFHAWSLLEQGENLSKQEKCQDSIKCFQSAVKYLQESKSTLEAELQKIDKKDEENLVKELIEASTFRVDYCSGRIEIEEAKILDKQGNHVDSSEKYSAAARVFWRISGGYSERIAKEVRPLVFLCQAWQKMTIGEARNSPIMFEEASELFKRANEYARNESESFLALAHSSFCRALEAGTEFEITRNMDMHRETKKHFDAASNFYLRAGLEAASEYAKATQHLFDAYVFIDRAKRETDPGKEAKFFSMAEKVLVISSDSYVKAAHQEKSDLVQRLLQKIQAEKELALSLSEVFHAPSVTSSTGSFTTISPVYEMAVGLERFEHADIQAEVIRQKTEISVGEETSLKVQIVNVGKEAVLLSRIEGILPVGFQLVGKPDDFSFENMQLSTMGKRLEPLKTEEIEFTLRPLKSGLYEAQPRIICVSESGEQLAFRLDAVNYKVSDAILPGRVSTGYKDLDNLLLGGLPEEYAVVLVSPSNDERQLIVKRFLETGLKKEDLVFDITAEISVAKSLAEEFPSNLSLFICNPRAEILIKNLPNVYKIKGVENLTELDLNLVKAFRALDSSQSRAKRACIQVLSDVLLQHHAVIARKWLSGLLADLRSRGFTTLAIVNPQMHSTEELHSILGLFDGEIRISERETDSGGLEKILRIRKLYNQRYLENELIVTRQRLET